VTPCFAIQARNAAIAARGDGGVVVVVAAANAPVIEIMLSPITLTVMTTARVRRGP